MFNPVFNPKKLQGFFCQSPWNSITIEDDGFVYSCQCARWTNLKLGNLLKENLLDIYRKSPHLQSLRETVKDGTYSWCVEWDCNEIDRLPTYKEDPFKEFNVDENPILPTNITLAIDLNCNLKCPSCRSFKTFSNIPNPVTKKILDSLAESYRDFNQQTMVMLDGGGDVFVSKAYEEFLFTGNLPKCWKLMILTNGNLIPKRKEEIQKIAHQIDMVTISLDAGTEETYAITRGGSFENVIKGIEILKEMGISQHLQFVLQKANYKELLEYKAIADKYDISYGVQKIDNREHMTKDYWTNANLDDNPDVDYALLKEYLTILRDDPKCNLDGGTRWLLAKL
jgi:radical SAM protein with 4Fe4S-binding SPASM domain